MHRLVDAVVALQQKDLRQDLVVLLISRQKIFPSSVRSNQQLIQLAQARLILCEFVL